MNTKNRTQPPKEEDSMIGFALFMIACPFICIAGIACALNYSSKIDSIPNWLILSFITSVLAIFGLSRLIKIAKR
jgi:hypothetical protein